MALELRITFDGNARGLQSHSLSLAAFAHALDRLVVALQRTGSALLKDVPDAPLGPISAKAKELDLELTNIEHNCVSLALRCVEPEVPEALADGPTVAFAQRVVSKLMHDIASEAAGQEVNEAVRRYVKALPDGTATQTYKLSRDGVLIDEVTCGVPPHVQNDNDLPRLVQLRGEVAGVGFLPTINVLFKSGEKVLKLNAEVAHVDEALQLRGRTVLAAVMLGDKDRLVHLREEDPTRERASISRTIQHARERWSEALDILAQ